MKNREFLSFTTKAIVSMALVVFTACDGDEADLGLAYVNDNQLSFGELEMTPVVTYTTTFDSVRSNSPSTGIGLFGGYTDGEFGRHDAVLSTHLLPGGVPTFGTNPVCDSAFLFIPYTLTSSAYYGDTTQPFTVVVNTLRNYLDPDSAYYSNRSFPVDKEIANFQFTPNPRKRQKFEYLTAPRPMIKIPISTSFIEDDIFTLEGSAAFETTLNFINAFFGIQLSSDANAEAILGLLVPSTETRLRMYFHNDDSSDTLFYDLGMGTSGEFVNSFTHDYSSAAFDIQNQDEINGEVITYCQAMGGVVTAIEIPNIAEYQDSGWLLNRAELVLPVREGSAVQYDAPGNLQIVVDNPDQRSLIFDYFSEGSGRVDGDLSVGEFRDSKYTFVITRQVQRFLDKEDDVARFLVIPENSPSDQSRTVLNGNLSSFEPAVFKLYYTRTK